MASQRGVSDIVGWLRAADDPDRLAGAAFLVSESLALTCAHVVRDHLGLGEPTPLQLPAEHVKLRFDRLGREIEAKVAPLGWWPDSGDGEIRDVAVLILLQPLDVLCPALAIVPPPPDLPCEVYGGTGKYPPYGQTVKSLLTADPNNLGWRQLDTRSGQESGYIVRRGFSGSPVLDPLRTTVWGMVATVETEPGTRVAFAIAIEDLRQATRTVAAEARQRHDPVTPARERAPDPLDRLGREALEALLGDALPAATDGQAMPPERVEELRSTVRALVEAARAAASQPHSRENGQHEPSRGQIAHALEALAAGRSDEAEDLLGELVELREAQGAAAYAEAAEAARHLGALAYEKDTRRAIAAYRTATRIDPDDVWSWIFLGRLQQQAGRLGEAAEAYRQARQAAERTADERYLPAVDDGLGDVLRDQGDLAQALASYGASLAIAERLAAADPGNAGWQADLAIGYERLGDVAAQNKNATEAITAFERALAIYEGLLARYPDNIQILTFSVVPRWRLGSLGGAEGRPQLEHALGILKDLQEADRLDANRKGWIAEIEAELAG